MGVGVWGALSVGAGVSVRHAGQASVCGASVARQGHRRCPPMANLLSRRGLMRSARRLGGRAAFPGAEGRAGMPRQGHTRPCGASLVGCGGCAPMAHAATIPYPLSGLGRLRGTIRGAPLGTPARGRDDGPAVHLCILPFGGDGGVSGRRTGVQNNSKPVHIVLSKVIPCGGCDGARSRLAIACSRMSMFSLWCKDTIFNLFCQVFYC